MKYQLVIRKMGQLFALISLLFSLSSQAAIFITPKAPKIDVATYIVQDYHSGKIIASQKMHQKRPPASLSKLMSAYVVFSLIKDNRISLEDKVLISEKAWKTSGSKSFVEVGKTIKLEILLKAMIIQSGNDAAVALAEHIAGTEDTFSTYMNEYAAALGMKNSHFKNASGLPYKGQYTSAFDMALLAAASIRNFAEFYPWYSQKEFTYHGIKQRSRNKLLWIDRSIDGLKTGFTKKAGYCLVASANRIGMRLISVVLGADTVNARNAGTQIILNYGFRFFQTQKLDNIKKQIAIHKSTKKTLSVGLENPAHLTLLRGQFKLSKQVIALDNELTAPIKKGTVIGNLVIIFEDETLAKFPLIALENAEKAGIFSRIFDAIFGNKKP